MPSQKIMVLKKVNKKIIIRWEIKSVGGHIFLRPNGLGFPTDLDVGLTFFKVSIWVSINIASKKVLRREKSLNYIVNH